jgi:hypothetical protein
MRESRLFRLHYVCSATVEKIFKHLFSNKVCSTSIYTLSFHVNTEQCLVRYRTNYYKICNYRKNAIHTGLVIALNAISQNFYACSQHTKVTCPSTFKADTNDSPRTPTVIVCRYQQLSISISEHLFCALISIR